MHKKRPKICTCCRVSKAKFYLYHSTKIAKDGPGFDDPIELPFVQINSSSPLSISLLFMVWREISKRLREWLFILCVNEYVWKTMPLKCEICGYRFSEQNHLNTHFPSVHRRKLFRWYIYDFSISKKDVLWNRIL